MPGYNNLRLPRERGAATASPGDTLKYVTDALRRSDIRFVHVRHEEAGGFAATADAMLTDELALCEG